METQGTRDFICINVLNTTLSEIEHTSNMLELTFQALDQMIDYPLVFQIQCPFRLYQNGEVIMTDNDMYYPVDDSTDFSLDNASRLDAILAKLKVKNSSLTVKNIEITSAGDILIELRSAKNTFIFESFNNATEDRESWRFFVNCCDDTPIVFYRNGIVVE